MARHHLFGEKVIGRRHRQVVRDLETMPDEASAGPTLSQFLAPCPFGTRFGARRCTRQRSLDTAFQMGRAGEIGRVLTAARSAFWRANSP